MHLLRLLPLSALAVVLSAAGAMSAPPPSLDLNSPYKLHIVLDVGRNRLLTDVFRQQVRREMRDSLRAAFGDLAEVTVRDQHPRLAEVRKEGLQAALDRWREQDDIKTHFVLIDYSGGQYVVQARQHCGLTGQPSPVVRRTQTADRQLVARLAALMVDRDFGLVGQVPGGADPKNIQVQIKGAALGGGVARRVKPGALFLVGSGPVRLDEAIIVQVKEMTDKGECRGRLFARYTNPLKGGGLYRCLGLATVSVPLRIRLVERGAPPPPASGLQVEIRRQGFDGETDIMDITDPQGYLSQDRNRPPVFENVAFITVKTDPQARIPLPLVDDRLVLLRVSPRPTDARTLVRYSKEAWEQQVHDAGLAQRNLFRDLQALASKPTQRTAALERAKEALRASRAEMDRLKQERRKLLDEAKTARTGLDLTFGDSWLQALSKGHAGLESYIDAQTKILKEENDPQRKEWLELIEQGRQEERRYEFGKALALYKKALENYPKYKDNALEAHYAKLSERWKPRSEEHRKARLFIYKQWPAADILASKESIEEASKALDICRMAGDTLAPLKLLDASIGHAGKLQERRAALQLDISEDDRRTAEVLAERSEALKKLIVATQGYLQAQK
jgi:hypothetical protein